MVEESKMRKVEIPDNKSLIESNYALGYPDNKIFLSPKEVINMAGTETYYKRDKKNKNKKMFKLVYGNLPGLAKPQSHYMCDIKLGPDRSLDSVFEKSAKYVYNIRRGFSFIASNQEIPRNEGEIFGGEEEGIAPESSEIKLPNYITVRKGLMKFFDVNPDYLIPTPDRPYDQIHNYILSPLIKTLNRGEKIEVLETRKANGENAQVSYLKNGGWICASKNVGILIRDEKDLVHYDSKGDKSRFEFAIRIARVWLGIVKEIEGKGLLEELKEDMGGRTFIAEYVGNPNYQHLIRYNKITLHFYAIVDNHSIINSLDPIYANSLFHKYQLPSVKFQSLGIYTQLAPCLEAILSAYINVAKSSIYDGEEGSVIYFVHRSQQPPILDFTLVLCKLKTLDYRIYRKLREKLKNYMSSLKTGGNKGGNIDRKEKIRSFKKDYEKLVKDTLGKALGYAGLTECSSLSHLPSTVEYYDNVAELAFGVVSENYLNEELNNQIHNKYVDFLDRIMDEVNRGYIYKFLCKSPSEKLILITPPFYSECPELPESSYTFYDLERNKGLKSELRGILHIYWFPYIEQGNVAEMEALSKCRWIVAGYGDDMEEGIAEFISVVKIAREERKETKERVLEYILNMEEEQLELIYMKYYKNYHHFISIAHKKQWNLIYLHHSVPIEGKIEINGILADELSKFGKEEKIDVPEEMKE